MSAITVGAMLDESAERHPSNEALVIGKARLTYAELQSLSDRVAAGLLELGIRPGDRIALLTANVAEAYASLFAVAKMGGIFVPLNPRLQPRELEYVLKHSGASALLFNPSDGRFDYVERLREVDPQFGRSEQLEILPELRTLVSIGGDAPGAETFNAVARLGSEDEPLRRLREVSERIDARDPVLLQFTSGTTSFPKGAVVAHEPTVRMGYLCGENFALGPDDRYFVCNPICHMGGTTFSLIAAMSHGTTFVTLPAFDARTALQTMQDERCTVQHGIDSHYIMELSEDGFADFDVKLRLCSVVGGSEVMARIQDGFRPDVVLSAYGSTETGGAPICGSVTDAPDRLTESAGRALPGVELHIVDPETGADLAPNKPGEVRIGGWSLMLGYFEQPEETKAQLDSKGRACTGDLARVDDDGYLFFMGRIKNMLRTGGENVSPEEVEAVLEAHPKVRRAVVVGAPHDRLGEVGLAYVVPKSGEALGEADLREHCVSQLASFKVPRHFRVVGVDAIPMTESGKVERRAVQELAAREDLDRAS